MSLVLFYHQVGPAGVSPDDFRRQLGYLRRKGYVFVGLDDLDGEGRRVSITFDDGFLETHEHAVPVLREMEIPATFFVVAGKLGEMDDWHCGKEKTIDESQVRELVKLGFAIGSHTMNHPSLDEIPLDRVQREVEDSKIFLEKRLGVPIRHFAYPKGLFTSAVAEVVRAAGYAAGWATREGDTSLFTRKRYPVSDKTSMRKFAWRLRRIRWGFY